MGAMQKPPLMLEGMTLDGLWLGAVNQLPGVARFGRSPRPEARAALGQLPGRGAARRLIAERRAGPCVCLGRPDRQCWWGDPRRTSRKHPAQ